MRKLTLHPDDGGRPIEIESPLVRIGRDAAADLCLQDPSVSRHHAEIENRGEGWFIFDLNSSNGIRIEGVLVPEAKLTYGASLLIGQVGFRVEIEGENENATLVLDRAPDFDQGAEKTMLVPPPLPTRPRSVSPPVYVVRRPAQRSPDAMGTITVVLVVIALFLAGLEAYQMFANRPVGPTELPAEVPTAAQEIVVPRGNAAPAASGPATSAGASQATILVSTERPATVSIDGLPGTKLTASSMRQFKVEPGDHVVRYQGDGWQAEVVTKVRAGEQKLIRPSDDPAPAGPGGAPEGP